jgi:ribosomal protein S18 acetylase RimI-like enzyme
VKIRAATAQDLEQICVLADETAELHHLHEPEVFVPPDTQRDRAFWLASIEQDDGTTLVAEKLGRIVGFVTARMLTTVSASFLRPRITSRIGSIVVSRLNRREGIGTSLIRAIEAWAAAQSAVEVRLEVFSFNEEAIRFYAALGYATRLHTLCRSLP